MKTSDPAYWMLSSGHTSTPEVYEVGCYICEDPEFAAMGLPLCKPCPMCRAKGGRDGHIPADDSVCSNCGYDIMEQYFKQQAG
jgi:hypothetical protein